jgi:hypothetical protein
MPPHEHAVDNSRVFSRDFEGTWTSVIQFFTTHNIQIKTIEKASGVIYAERSYAASSDAAPYADCGSAGLWVVLSTSVQFNVFVIKDGVSTKVTVNTTFKQQRQFQSTVMTVECTSTGGLEQQVLSAL